MKKDSQYWIKNLELLPHPEGGYYKEVYRDQGLIKREALVGNFSGDRNFSTAIFYLLEKGDYSCFHRIKSDELWHFYAGDTLNIYYLDNGRLHTLKLGINLEKDESPICIIPKNTWFAAELSTGSNFALMGCTVAPGFHFADFEKASKEDLNAYKKISQDLLEKLVSKA